MALTSCQRRIVRLISQSRKDGGESYVAGRVALNELIGAARLSRDIDLFHDTREAVRRSFEDDHKLIQSEGHHIQVLVDREGFIEALVASQDGECLLQWAQDSAFRFFPLVEHSELGLALHPFDLATNKVLALVGRAEARDWVDIIACDERVQPLGYLAWAATGKDPGLNPAMILEEATRSARYADGELKPVEFAGERPSAAELAQSWKQALRMARGVIEALPAQEVGKCVLLADGSLARIGADELKVELQRGTLRFHAGSIRGALPTLA